MKTKLLLIAGACAISLVGMGSAVAAPTAEVTVNASVTGTCQFDTTSNTIDFTLDPTSGTDALSTTANFNWWCTNGTPGQVYLGVGQNDSGGTYNMTDGTNDIPYTLALTGTVSATGGGKSDTKVVTVRGTVANSNFINAVAGSYTDKVVLQFTP